tara:strand:+ start:16334 stop:16645 length:312 start_codon:yes stop_codon:yes gene_type:complete
MKRRIIRVNNLQEGIRRFKFVPDSNIVVVRTEEESPVVLLYNRLNHIIKIEFENGPILAVQDVIHFQERGRLRILRIKETVKDNGLRQFALEFLKSDSVDETN